MYISTVKENLQFVDNATLEQHTFVTISGSIVFETFCSRCSSSLVDFLFRDIPAGSLCWDGYG
jgi:hypothetical protein